MGPLLLLACVFFLTAAHFASLPASGRAEAALVSFAAGSGLALVWAVLESSWRHAHLDELTQLPTRRTLQHDLAGLGAEFAIAMVDIDHFKNINDTYGHDTGDQALRYLASCLASTPAGRAYRLGGEEFVLLSEGREWNEVLRALEALRSAIAQKRFGVRAKNRPRRKPRREGGRRDSPDVPILSLTISIGAARSGSRYATPQEVLQAADRALYQAKDKGRNQVCVAR
jgi:GGDEF domain-containing protein